MSTRKKKLEVVVFPTTRPFLFRRFINESLMSVEFPKNLKLPDTTENGKPSNNLPVASKISEDLSENKEDNFGS